VYPTFHFRFRVQVQEKSLGTISSTEKVHCVLHASTEKGEKLQELKYFETQNSQEAKNHLQQLLMNTEKKGPIFLHQPDGLHKSEEGQWLSSSSVNLFCCWQMQEGKLHSPQSSLQAPDPPV
jgi:hypothetical protein